jgi:type I restriction enzyme S subunit
MKGKFPANFNTYQLVEKSNFVFCLFDVEETPRTVGLSYEIGMITGAYSVYESKTKFDERFLLHYLTYLDDGKRLKPLYRGLRNTLPKSSFESMKVPLPELKEQKMISKLLDNLELKFLSAVESRNQLSKLLQERESAIVIEALTGKGKILDKKLPWAIPSHWEVKPFWAVGVVRDEKGFQHLDLLSVYLHRGVIAYSDGGGQVHKPSLDLSNYQRVLPGDLVLNNQQAWRGSVGVSNLEGIISPAYIVVDVSSNFNLGFSNYLFRSAILVSQFELASKGVGSIQRGVHPPSLRRVMVPIPPISEQEEIFEKLEHQLASIRSALNHIDHELALLNEYKLSVHDAIYTGKLDARDLAKDLESIDPDDLLKKGSILLEVGDLEESLDEQN